MSGGYFDYQQYRITDIADSIQSELDKQGTPKPKDELWDTEDYYEKHPEELNHFTYPIAIQGRMKEGIAILKIASVYAQRIDWFLSGDDGEESFLKRLDEELNCIK